MAGPGIGLVVGGEQDFAQSGLGLFDNRVDRGQLRTQHLGFGLDLGEPGFGLSLRIAIFAERTLERSQGAVINHMIGDWGLRIANEEGGWGIGSGEWGQRSYFPTPDSRLPFFIRNPQSNHLSRSTMNWAM